MLSVLPIGSSYLPLRRPDDVHPLSSCTSPTSVLLFLTTYFVHHTSSKAAAQHSQHQLPSIFKPLVRPLHFLSPGISSEIRQLYALLRTLITQTDACLTAHLPSRACIEHPNITNTCQHTPICAFITWSLWFSLFLSFLTLLHCLLLPAPAYIRLCLCLCITQFVSTRRRLLLGHNVPF